MMRKLLLFVGLLAGCAGTETGNPKPPALELRLSAFSSDFNQVSVGRPGGGISVEHAFVRLESVQLLPCAADGKVVVVPVGEVELTERPPRLVVAESDETEFCAARLLLVPAAGDLAGLSAVIEGVRADGVPFRIASRLELTLDLKADPSTPFAGRRLLLAFNLASWLRGVGVETADIDASAVSIDETHQPDKLATFETQASSAPALYDDADGNGQLAGDNQPPAAGP